MINLNVNNDGKYVDDNIEDRKIFLNILKKINEKVSYSGFYSGEDILNILYDIETEMFGCKCTDCIFNENNICIGNCQHNGDNTDDIISCSYGKSKK